MTKQKALQTAEQIKEALNLYMANSVELESDCKECRVKRIGRVTEAEAKQLGRNWNVDMLNGECKGECHDLLVDVAKAHGLKYDAVW